MNLIILFHVLHISLFTLKEIMSFQIKSSSNWKASSIASLSCVVFFYFCQNFTLKLKYCCSNQYHWTQRWDYFPNKIKFTDVSFNRNDFISGITFNITLNLMMLHWIRDGHHWSWAARSTSRVAVDQHKHKRIQETLSWCSVKDTEIFQQW